MKKIGLMVLGLLAMAGVCRAESISATLLDNSALAYDSAPSFDSVAQGVGKLSIQTVYSTATIPAVSATDGRVSTISITVANNAVLSPLSSSNTITISSNAACKYGWVKINDFYFVEPYQFQVFLTTHNVGFSTQTAQNLTNAINQSAASATITAVRSASTIYLASKSSGAHFNSYTLNSSSPAAYGVTVNNFYNGRDGAQLRINNTTLINGRDWFTGASAYFTAQSISSAVLASSGLSGVVISSHNGSGVVFATSTAVGANSTQVYTSTQAALTLASYTSLLNGAASGYFMGGADNNVSGGYVNKSNSFAVGLPVLYSTTTGNIAPLVSQTTYYVTAVDNAKFKLASSRANAQAGTAISFTSFVATGTVSAAFTPIAYSAGVPAAYKFQRSNDGSNWADMPVSSGTVYATAVSSAQAVDFGDANFRYYRVNFSASTFGAANIKAFLCGK